MSLLPTAAFFALGAISASFVGVVVARLSTGQSFFSGRSRCDACDVPLAPAALVPILSYAAARARARCCGARISHSAPLAELALGGFFALTYITLGMTIALPFMLASLVFLLALVLYDLQHQILPPALLGAFVFLSAATGFFLAPSRETFSSVALTALLIAASLALIHLLSRGRAIGFSDAPFAFGLALLTGPAAFAGFIFSFWIGAAIGIVVLFTRPIGSRMGVEVPFAPFLAAGFLLAYFTQWNPFILIAASLFGN
ncbi:MAG: prepilin peptidase [Candidatus Paceibacterota bacterium]|jgi:leader peptidase (prepilin peptidase)/N-methyltransferase